MRDVAPIGSDRARVGWWLLLLLVGGIALFVALQYFGAIVLGVFSYYGTRPIYRRIRGKVGSDRVAATAAILGIVLPVLALLAYTAVHLLHNVQMGGGGIRGLVNQYLAVQQLTTQQWSAILGILQNPGQLFTTGGQSTQGALSSIPMDLLRRIGRVLVKAVLYVALGLTLGYFLLRTDSDLADAFRRTVGGRETAAYAYATAVDRDLESLYYGNLLFVVAMAAVAAAVYEGANLLAPQGLHIPIPLVLAVLTGVASLVPLVVGKLVYVPVVLYLSLQALSMEATLLWFPAAVLAVSFLLLDILPQTFLQPYITGKQVHLGLMMFAYILGPLVFGWYGFFFLPMVAIFLVQAVRFVWLDLVHGERLSGRVTIAPSLGSDPAVGPGSASGDED